jgi:hypothetical protein
MTEEPNRYKYRYIGIIEGSLFVLCKDGSQLVHFCIVHTGYVRADTICNVVMNYFVSC